MHFSDQNNETFQTIRIVQQGKPHRTNTMLIIMYLKKKKKTLSCPSLKAFDTAKAGHSVPETMWVFSLVGDRTA